MNLNNEPKKNSRNRIWLSWNNSRRSRTLGRELGLVSLIKEIQGNAIKRHFLSFIWTISILACYRPRTIYCQYSYILLVILAIYRKLAPYTVMIICDCHTKALMRNTLYLSSTFNKLKRISFTCAQVVIVSNEENKKKALLFHGNIIIVPDLLPTLLPNNNAEKNYINSPYVVFSLSYDTDEPIDAILASTKYIKPHIQLYLTGKPPLWLMQFQFPQNVHLTDFLDEDQYVNLLSRAACIVGLTTESGCLQSSGYEAISLNIPFVTSNTSMLRLFFGDAAIYTGSHHTEISSAIEFAIENRKHFKKNIKLLKHHRRKEDRLNLNLLKKLEK